ncbi:MAG: glycoside hydrolase family 1 protein [bacterium]|nr:glycoside hydrolase family 1 protein [bacterium]
MLEFKFPKDFLWGSATSAHQVEGNTKNDWTEWEFRNAKRLAIEAAKKTWPEYINNAYPNPLRAENYISGKACDHYNRFKEDFDMAKSLGHNAYRFSIEWSRIEPEEGKFDEKEIEHYRQVIRALKERGIEPFVTLWHWTLPLWVRDFGGVESKKFIVHFERYVRYVVLRLGSDVIFWMTLNEPTSVIAAAYTAGKWPPQKRNIIAALRVFRRLACAHRRAYRAIHEVQANAQVGFGNVLHFFEAYNVWNPLDWISVFVSKFFTNQYFFWLTGKDAHDYIAIQNYFHNRIAFPWRLKNNNEKVSDMGWELYPESLYYILKEWEKLKRPIYITENGLADARDNDRAWFIREAFKNISRAIQEGADVRGYFYWSLLDNFEWDKGFWPRFGLVEVNFKTLERKIRPSALEYKKIIENRGVY